MGRDLVETWLGVLRGRRCLLAAAVAGRVPPASSAAVISRVSPEEVVLVTAFLFAAVRPIDIIPGIFLRNTSRPAKRKKTPRPTTEIYHMPNKTHCSVAGAHQRRRYPYPDRRGRPCVGVVAVRLPCVHCLPWGGTNDGERDCRENNR